jgi:hypothetical protein
MKWALCFEGIFSILAMYFYNLGQVGVLRRHKSQSPHMGLQLGTFGHLLKWSIVHTLVLKGWLVNLVGFLELFFDVTKT